LPRDGISPEVRLFIHRTINSVEQLEVLLFMMSNPDRDWSTEEVARQIRVPPASVNAKLEELHEARLLKVERTATSCFRYAPDSAALEAEVAESLDRAYRERKDTIIKLIFSRPLNNIRVFADAFRIRRDH
jgi:hypothetical protein